MPIFKRPNSSVWWISVQVNGRQVRKSAQTANRKEAQELHDQLKSALWREEKLGEKAEHSLDEAAEKWLAENANLRAVRDYTLHLKFWCERAQGMALTDITRAWAAQQMDDLVIVRGKTSKPATPGTKNNYICTLRSVMNTALTEWEWIENVPAFRTYGGKKVPRMCIATPEQAKALIAVMPEQLQGPIAFAFMTGLRKSNVYGLRWAQVDLDRSVAWVKPDDAKAGNLIVVPLNSAARAVLARQAEMAAAGEERVFPVEPCCHHQWKRYTARAGLPEGFRFHDIRHSFASWHAMAGTERKSLQDLGGWQTSAMVDHYVHLPAQHLVGAAEKLSALLN
jgi:integrase